MLVRFIVRLAIVLLMPLMALVAAVDGACNYVREDWDAAVAAWREPEETWLGQTLLDFFGMNK